jgi:hypothetical protein
MGNYRNIDYDNRKLYKGIKMTLHSIVLYILIRVAPKLFDRYLDEYNACYDKRWHELHKFGKR